MTDYAVYFFKQGGITLTIDITEVNSTRIGEMVEFRGIITEIQQPQTKLKNGLFVCKSCFRKHEVPQKIFENGYRQPTVCQECGSKKFELILGESTFAEIQFITVGKPHSVKRLKVCFIDSGEIIDEDMLAKSKQIRGKVVLIENKNKFETVVVCHSWR